MPDRFSVSELGHSVRAPPIPPAPPGRSRAVDEYLVRQVDGIALLLTPPFDRTTHDPGYIKGYLPGIRENGGQYTHAAVWALMAHAVLGNGDRAIELFNLINPINHGKTRLGVQRYKAEPYVLAGDVYGELPHVGRGGWSWYTGSAAWMYRAGIEWILGFRLEGTTLCIDPCIPHEWPGFKMTFRYHSARYEILVDNPERICRGVRAIVVDDRAIEEGEKGVGLIDDGATHVVQVVLGTAEETAPLPRTSRIAPVASGSKRIARPLDPPRPGFTGKAGQLRVPLTRGRDRTRSLLSRRAMGSHAV